MDRTITKEELNQARGGEGANLWVALYNPKEGKVIVYDVSSRADLYGPGGSYEIFAGRNASRALGLMALDEKESHIDDLTEEQLTTLQGWCDKYNDKYTVVGVLEN